MASTSEIRTRKKLIANLNLLNTNIIAIGAIYNPSNPKLLLTNLQNIYTNAFNQQESVNNPICTLFGCSRWKRSNFQTFKSWTNKTSQGIQSNRKGVTQVQLEDFMTIVRKLKGVRKTTKETSTNPDEAQVNYSTSQMSYDQRTNNMDLLIALLQNTPNFNPNETEYKVVTYQDKKAQNAFKNSSSCRYIRSVK